MKSASFDAISFFSEKKSYSQSDQERDIYRPSFFMQLPVGTFVGRIAEWRNRLHTKFIMIKRERKNYDVAECEDHIYANFQIVENDIEQLISLKNR